ETVEPEKLRGNAVGGAARKPDKGGVPANPAVSLPKKLVPLRR
ncbi:MAG: hypothetical protein RJB13_2118, partial [Pseudomonadota bacterium]